ncbi:Rpn family recombination-promoting nuclease/putative transposase [Leptolyngbyaceae cyanobacterium UHCC 1019]
MKTDSLFYRLFSDHPELVFELMGEEVPAAVSYTFGSQEVKQTSFRLDGILTPSVQEPNSPIVFVEVMGYRDNNLYFSFFAEIFLYLKDFTPANDWQAVLIFSRQGLDPGLSVHFQDFDNSSRFRRIYLDQLPADAVDRSLELDVLQLIGVQEAIAPDRARQLIQRAQQEATDVAEQQRIVELITTILVYKFPNLSREEIRQMLGLDELKQTRFYQEVKQEGREEGVEEGREEGREEGVEETVARLAPMLLNLGATVEQIAAQLQVDVETVQRFIQSDGNN